jgi:hypothetical protein
MKYDHVLQDFHTPLLLNFEFEKIKSAFKFATKIERENIPAPRILLIKQV